MLSWTWGHARDFVEAMYLMLQQPKPDDYVIATGETHTIKNLLTVAFERVGLDWKKYVGVDPKYYRPTEVDLLPRGRIESQACAEVGT